MSFAVLSMQSVYTHSRSPLPLFIFSISVILYPSIDVISIYSTGVHITVNNINALLSGFETSKEPSYRFDCLFKLILRFIVALLPVLAAFGNANLIYVLKYAGIAGFGTFLMPFILQIRSIQVCKTKFSQPNRSALNSQKNGSSDGSSNEVNESTNGKSRNQTDDQPAKGKSYMTPYSYPVISHPITSWVMLFVWIILSFILLSSLVLRPQDISCLVDLV